MVLKNVRSKCNALLTDILLGIEAAIAVPIVILSLTALWIIGAGIEFVYRGCKRPRCKPVVCCHPAQKAAVDACPLLNQELDFPWWMYSGSAGNMIFSIVGRFRLPTEHISFSRFVIRRPGTCVLELDVREAETSADSPVEDVDPEVQRDMRATMIVPSAIALLHNNGRLMFLRS